MRYAQEIFHTSGCHEFRTDSDTRVELRLDPDRLVVTQVLLVREYDVCILTDLGLSSAVSPLAYGLWLCPCHIVHDFYRVPITRRGYIVRCLYTFSLFCHN